MSDILYPTIKLYIYDLRNGLGQDSEEIKNNRQKFQSKISKENLQFNGDYLFYLDTDFEAEYVELLGDKRIEEFSDKSCEGYYYPVRLGDTYGLLLDCSVKDQINYYPANYFKHIKAQIDNRLKNQPATVGQTWMLSASLADCPGKSPELIAKDCYEAVMPSGNWSQDLQGQGNVLGGKVFELWQYRLLLKEENHSSSSQYSLHRSIQNIQDNEHFIIALYPNQDIAKKASEFIFDWMPLFCYRHKIMLASAQSRYLKHQLKKDFVFIQNGIKDITQASSQKLELTRTRQILNNAQKTLASYSTNISYFDYQIRNINLNLENYKKRLIKFQITASSSDLTFLERFSNHVENKDLLQLKKDYDNLSPGLQLLEGLMKSIVSLKNIMEIDEEERDRRFQNNIAIFGIGLGSASLVAQASSSYVEVIQDVPSVKEYLREWNLEPKKEKPDLADAVVSITFSVLVGVLFGTLAYLILKINTLWRKHR